MLKTIIEKTEPLLKPPKTMEAPSSRELASHFHRFLKYWAGADLDYQGPALDREAPFPVELSVRLQGTVRGTLVLSCSTDFLKWLQANRDYKTIHLSTASEILVEMTTLYCVFLIQKFWLTENFEMGPILPRPSTPDHWPTREPDSTCLVRTGENQLELRLWVD